MLHITLTDMRILTEAELPCPMGRTWVGYAPGMSEQEIYEVNRGRWVLGVAADREHYVLFTVDGFVKAAVEIHRIRASNGVDQRDPDGRRVIEGEVLTEKHPVWQHYVDKPSPVVGLRNPIKYHYDPHFDGRVCGCGCGEAVSGASHFIAGHDQRAIHERIARIGSVTEFLTWFDERCPAGTQPE